MKPVKVHEGIDSTLMILQSHLKPRLGWPGIQVVKEYGNLAPVECYAGQLNQVFMNVLSNAIDALEADPKFLSSDAQLGAEPTALPTIHIRMTTLDSSWLLVEITDNGPGMPEHIKSRIFNPFFTTKSVGKGTGLGLSISYQIVVEKHNGRLECSSIVGQGTTFRIHIPIQRCAETQLTLTTPSQP